MRFPAKDRFLASKPAVEAHARLVEQLNAAGSADVALLVYQESLHTPDGNLNIAAVNQCRLEGARGFLTALMTLHEQPVRPKSVRAPALNHDAQ